MNCLFVQFKFLIRLVKGLPDFRVVIEKVRFISTHKLTEILIIDFTVGLYFDLLIKKNLFQISQTLYNCINNHLTI